MHHESNTANRIFRVFAFATILAIVGAAAAPISAAHTCTAEKGEPGEDSCHTECKDGENHDHTVTHHHENGVAKDENHVHYQCNSEWHDDPNCPVPDPLGYCVLSEATKPAEVVERLLGSCKAAPSRAAPAIPSCDG